MSFARFRVVAHDELLLTLRRPMVWILLIVIALLLWGISTGNVSIVIASGDATVGGKKAWLTSEFALTQIITVTSFSVYLFGAAAAAGGNIIRDADAGALELLQSTPLTPWEYALGKFAGTFAGFMVMLAIHVLLAMLFLHWLPNADMLETRGPFELANYLKPLFLFAVPTVLFAGGTAFAIGALTRKAILVFVLPVAFLLLCGFFLWTWSPGWLSPAANKALMLADPAGVRWLSETWLKVDRGADFYNTQPVSYDAIFAANRVLFVGIALAAVYWGARGYAASVRAAHRMGALDVARALENEAAAAPVAVERPVALPPTFPTAAAGFWRSAWRVGAAEARELRSHPGLYLFVPVIILQVVSTMLLAIGAFDTPLLLVPGALAVSSTQALGTLVALLLVFYGVESMERERSTRLNAIQDAAPLANGAIVAGKLLALGVVMAVITLAVLVAAVVAILIQGKVRLTFWPFGLVWGVLLLPTYLVWATLVFAVYAITRNRFTTYGVVLGLMALTFYLFVSQHWHWLVNWPLWGSVPWSDLSVLEFDRRVLIWNRLEMLSLAALFAYIAITRYPRLERDATRTIHALAPSRMVRSVVRAWPVVLAPLICMAFVAREVSKGPEGARAQKIRADYWKKNLGTWKDAPTPWLRDADLDVVVEPERRAWTVQGSYLITNQTTRPMRQVPITVGLWDDMKWTLNGAPYVPDTTSHLYVFTPPVPLAPDDSVRIGFSYRGQQRGSTESGGGAGEFIVPSGLVMTGFGPQWFPLVGYSEQIGVEDENRYEPRQYPDDWYEGETPAAFASERPMTVRMRVTAPEGFTVNAVGERVSEQTDSGRTVTEWRTDQPVMAFNIVGGRYAVKRGAGTALYYHEAHSYNVDEMIDAMNNARRWYGEWFGAYPWKELKVSEFPGLATYAQGFPTNITFSEAIGFLTKSEPKTNLAFLVTAHEIAHQWWGNMVQPGIGPSGNFLSEGMSHFATAMLIEQVKGQRNGIEFRKRIETRYGDQRRADAERKMFRVDGSKAGDGTLWYDKGGWVFWMLADRMGRENALRGMRDFVTTYRGNPDHPVLQDFAAFLRPYAPDGLAYDDFVKQWMDSVVVPEYRVQAATTVRLSPTEWETTATVENVGTGRMPIDVAVTRGERFPDDTAKVKKEAAYASASARVVLDGKQKQTVTIRSSFEPEKVVVDPDVRVLQLRRQSAESKVQRSAAP
jgi:ABC-type transport system involved in multi-copper enzyme maturation permease subunit